MKSNITPNRKRAVIALAKGRYQLAASSIFSFTKTHKYVLTAVTRQIRNEMKTICSLSHNSILRADHEAIKHFSWDVICKELVEKIPTLFTFIQMLLPKSENIFISSLICIILKQRCKHMSLFQRVVSVLLYGHGTSQQVNYVVNCLSCHITFIYL